MPAYQECQKCGSHLDFGERCDCEEKEETKNGDQLREMREAAERPEKP